MLCIKNFNKLTNNTLTITNIIYVCLVSDPANEDEEMVKMAKQDLEDVQSVMQELQERVRIK